MVNFVLSETTPGIPLEIFMLSILINIINYLIIYIIILSSTHWPLRIDFHWGPSLGFQMCPFPFCIPYTLSLLLYVLISLSSSLCSLSSFAHSIQHCVMTSNFAALHSSNQTFHSALCDDLKFSHYTPVIKHVSDSLLDVNITQPSYHIIISSQFLSSVQLLFFSL